MATYRCKNIVWDTDDPDRPEDPSALPDSVYVEINDEGMTPDDIIETVLDTLSDERGYCLLNAEITREQTP